MGSIAERRILKELAELAELRKDGTVPWVETTEGNMCNLLGKIPGPPDTPYVNGLFDIEIIIPKDTYPFSPPKCRFITKIWHPNISSVTGAICLDILKDNWGASMTIRTVLLSIQAMLAQPQPNDPQDAVVARQYRDNIQVFRNTARFWTSFWAVSKSDKGSARVGEHVEKDAEMTIMEGKMKEMVEACKVDRSQALTLLSANAWDIEAAKKSMSS